MTDVRNDAVRFAAEVLRIELWPHQIEPLRCRAPNVALVGGRRGAKSTTAQVKAIHVAATHRDTDVYVSHPNIDSAAYWLSTEAGDILRRSRLRESVEIQARSIVFRETSSRMLAIPATPGQMRGRGRRNLLWVLEEAGFLPASVMRDVRYTLMDHVADGAQLWMVGSPWGSVDHPFRQADERARDGDSDYAAFRFRMTDNPKLSRAYIERERERIAPSEAAAEIDGEWSDAIGSLFPRELLDRQTADIEVPGLGDLRLPARGIVGVDYGVSFDRSAAVVIYRLPVAGLNPAREPRPCFVALPYVWPAKTPLDAVVGEVAAGRDNWRYIATETNGVGAMPSQELWRRVRRTGQRHDWNMVNTTSATKTTGFGCVLALAERGQLVFPRHPDLLRQLAALRFEQGQRGFMHIAADDPAVHDDVADALYLASLPYRPRGARRVVCHMAALASPRLAIPEARVPELEDEVMETAAGLRLHRRPPLQSVTSTELSLYSNPIPQRRPAVQVGDFTIERTLT